MRTLLFLTAFTFLLSTTSCKKDDAENEESPTATAALEIQVLYVNSEPVVDAEVQLYGTQADYNDKSNVISTQTTDASGTVLFEKLEAKQYWWYVKKDGQDNKSSAYFTGANLVNGETLSKITQIR